MPAGDNGYLYSIRGLLLNKNSLSETIAEDIDEFISIAPSLAESIRSSFDERRRSFEFIKKINTAIYMLKAVSAKWILAEAETIRSAAESNHMDVCRRKIEPFLSNFLSLSIEMQMAQKRAAGDQAGPEKNEIEAYADVVNNLTAVSYLITANERERAREMLTDMDDLKDDPLAFDLFNSLRADSAEPAAQLTKRMIDKYTAKIEKHDSSRTDNLKKILVVDDRPDLLRLVAVVLKEHYKVFTVTAGKDALKLLETHSPDLFILDIDMPGMNGFELAERIRCMDEFSCTPILFLTSNSTRDYVLKAIESGASDFIVKPASRSSLLSRVAKYI